MKSPDSNAQQNAPEPQLGPTFKFGRFDRGAIPIESLSELRAYAKLVAHYAREIYLEENPKAKRPRGLRAIERMSLIAIRTGSAIPVLEPAADLSPTHRHLVYRAAARVRDEVENPDHTHIRRRPELVSLWLPFGKSLRGNECISLGPNLDGVEVIYSQKTREEIVAGALSSYDDEVEVAAEVMGGNTEGGYLQLKLIDGSKHKALCSDRQVEQTLRNFVGQIVVVSGRGLLDSGDKITELVSIASVEPVDSGEGSLFQQFESLTRLGPGWYAPDTPAYKAEHILKFRRFLQWGLSQGLADGASIFPAEDGTIRAEWSATVSDGWVEASASYNGSAQRIYAHVTSKVKGAVSSVEQMFPARSSSARDFASFINVPLRIDSNE